MAMVAYYGKMVNVVAIKCPGKKKYSAIVNCVCPKFFIFFVVWKRSSDRAFQIQLELVDGDCYVDWIGSVCSVGLLP